MRVLEENNQSDQSQVLLYSWLHSAMREYFTSLAPRRLLVELEIPGRTGPVPTGEWGVNVAAAQENFPRQGLQLFIPAWPVMGLGDSVAVFLGNAEITRKPILTMDEVGERQTLFIPVNRLTNSITTISYRVTRLGQVPEDSALTAVLIKLERPGGQDQNGSTPGHSELKLTLPEDIVQNGVDKATAAQGVPVTLLAYPEMAEHDLIQLTWGGQFVTHTVALAEVGQDIVIRVEEAIILAAGDSGGGGLAVAFEVYDLVENKSEDWSAEVRVVVDTGGTRLEAGIVKEADNNVLDLNMLGSAPATFQVIAMGNNFVVGDEIIVRLMGTSAQGEAVDITYPPYPIPSVPSVVPILIPNTHVRRLAKTQGNFSYQLKKADGTLLLAKGQFVRIIGEPAQLAAPLAKDAQDGGLDPSLGQTTVEVPWDESMAVGQVIDLKWYGTQPDFTVYFPELDPHNISNGEAEDKQPIAFYVEGRHLAAINGGTLELYYELILDDGTVRKSLASPTFRVGERRNELPAPTVRGAVDNALDPDTLPPNGTTMTVASYTGIALGDELHYSWMGSQSGAHTDWIIINKNNLGRPEFSLAIDLAKVRDNLGGTVEASYWVRRIEGRVSQSEVLTLRIGKAQEQLLDPVTIDELSDGKLDLGAVSAGANVALAFDPRMNVGDVVYLEWTDNQDNTYTPDGVEIWGNMLGKPVPFLVPFIEVQKNLNNTVTVNCRVETASGPTLRTGDLTFLVEQGSAQELDPVSIAELVEGSLDLRAVRNGANVELKAYDTMGVGDVVSLEWADNQGNAYTPQGTPLSSGMIGKPVPFIVPYGEIQKNEGNAVSVICRSKLGSGGELRTQVLTFEVFESASPALPAPQVAEANNNGVIDPTTVTAGATVVIDATAALVPGDQVQVVVTGTVGDSKTHAVTVPGEQRFTVDYAVIKANENSSIELQYFVLRGGVAPQEPSPSAEFDVRVVVGGGQLKVLGARFTRSTDRSSVSPRYLQAFHAGSEQLLQAEWKYASDTQWTLANRWRDTQPQSLLQVRTSDDQVTLNPANILGNGARVPANGNAAFVAHRDDGRVRGWGSNNFGADIPPVIRTLDDIVEVSCTTSAYAVRRVGGSLMVWGNTSNGGSMGEVAATGFSAVLANSVAFAGIKATGQVVAWGVAASGGTVPAPISDFTDIVSIAGTDTAFAALRSTRQVVAWGRAATGGVVPALIAALTDLGDVKGNHKAFAALRSSGSLVAWGDATSGGNAAPVANFTDIVEICCASAGAFVAKRASGHIVAWGDPIYGGNLPADVALFDDIIDVASNREAFAVVRANGSVLAWGSTADAGGVVPPDIADMTDVVQVTGSYKAFALLRRNGMVAAWGNPIFGGATTDEVKRLNNVQAIYSNTHGFVALTSDGQVVAWGHAAGGGDNTAVRDQLNGFVSYRATSAARGRALCAQRVVSAASLVV